MKVVITDTGRRHYFYEKGDVVKDVNKDVIYTVAEIDVKGKTILSDTGFTLPLSLEIRPTAETLNNAKVDDRRNRNPANRPYKKKLNLNIRIKYFDKDMPRLTKTEIGDWIDLRSARDITLKAGDTIAIPLGIAMELPRGYEAYVAPRGSTYKYFKLLQTNSVGVVDNSYKGDNDQWFMSVIAMEDTVINKYDRICQFRIQRKMPSVDFTEVEILENEDRSGYGSSGRA